MAITDAATFCATLVDEWIRAGVDNAFVAPGSRSTPLALALAGDDRLAVHLFHDERAASFAAVGFGLATGHPAVLLCTSGTAATHFHGAVVEADLSSVPLLVCTADRPPELWDVGAPQTIDQSRLYGSSVRFYAEPGVPDAAAAGSWRSLAARSVAEACGWTSRPGPVHLNLSFRDPLVGEPDELPPGRADGAPWHRALRLDSEAGARAAEPTDARLVTELAEVLWPQNQAVDGVIVAGGGTPDPDAVLALADVLGWPVLADHRSGCRRGPNAITHFDALLRSTAFARNAEPAVVVRFGEGLASKVLGQWLTATSATVIAAVDQTRWSDPERAAAMVLNGPGLAPRLLAAVPEAVTPADSQRRWIEADHRAGAAIDEVLAQSEAGPSEIEIARRTVAGLRQGGALVVSSSMPVRDIEWYGPNRPDIEVYANRGANGIDGVVATAIGVALSGRPTTVLIGDVAFLHDSTALIGLRERPIELEIVLIDNDGGGIFSFLPQARQLPHQTYEKLFGTPHGTDLEALAAAHGIATRRWSPDPKPIAEPSGVTVTLASSNREANAATHDRLHQAVIKAIEA